MLQSSLVKAENNLMILQDNATAANAELQNELVQQREKLEAEKQLALTAQRTELIEQGKVEIAAMRQAEHAVWIAEQQALISDGKAHIAQTIKECQAAIAAQRLAMDAANNAQIDAIQAHHEADLAFKDTQRQTALETLTAEKTKATAEQIATLVAEKDRQKEAEILAAKAAEKLKCDEEKSALITSNETDQVKALKAQLTEATTRIATHLASLAQANDREGALRAQLVQGAAAIESLQNTHAAESAKIRQHDADMRAAVASDREETEKLKVKLQASYDDALGKFTPQIQQVEAERDAAVAGSHELRTILSAQNKQLQTLRLELVEANSSIEEMKASRGRERNDALERFQAVTNDLNRAQRDIESLNSAAPGGDAEIEELKRQLRQAYTDAIAATKTAVEAEKSRHQAELNERDAEKTKLVAEIDSGFENLRREVGEANRKKDAEQAERERGLRAEIDQLRGEARKFPSGGLAPPAVPPPVKLRPFSRVDEAVQSTRILAQKQKEEGIQLVQLMAIWNRTRFPEEGQAAVTEAMMDLIRRVSKEPDDMVPSWEVGTLLNRYT